MAQNYKEKLLKVPKTMKWNLRSIPLDTKNPKRDKNNTSNRHSYLHKKEPENDIHVSLEDDEEDEPSHRSSKDSREMTLFDANSRQFGGSSLPDLTQRSTLQKI